MEQQPTREMAEWKNFSLPNISMLLSSIGDALAVNYVRCLRLIDSTCAVECCVCRVVTV